MNRLCDRCGHVYDDFNRSTLCPHLNFTPSETAKQLLTEGGICWRCGASNGGHNCPILVCPLQEEAAKRRGLDQ